MKTVRVLGSLIILALLVLMVLPTGAWALVRTGDGGWLWQNPKGGEALTDICFVDSLHGWALSPTGILSTNDGGTTWGRQWTPSTFGLSALCFVDQLHGWAVGDEGRVLVTADGGLSWAVRDSGATGNLNSVDFVDASHGWAVGADGTIRATSDGGQTWTSQQSGTPSYLTAVDFVDTMHGWAAASSQVLRTTDGGVTWSSQGLGTNLTDLSFADTTHGTAVSQDWDGWGYLFVYTTSDGGLTWTTQSLYLHAALNAVSQLDAMHVVAVGGSGTVVTSEDGGASWSQQATLSSADLRDVSFTDTSHGWIAAGCDVLATSNGGSLWAPLKQDFIETELCDVAFKDTSNGWALAYDRVFATSDGGATWVNQAYLAAPQRAIDVVDLSHAWTVGDNGVVYATIDGGSTWQLQRSQDGQYLRDVAFSTAQKGWAVGEYGLALSTADGGAHWQERHLGLTSRLNGVCFADPTHGWIVGDGGVILATSDGGTTWKRQRSRFAFDLAAVDFGDTLHGCAVGGSGRVGTSVLYTADGGAHWQAALSGASPSYCQSVSMPDATHVWTVNSIWAGQAYCSVDGGRTWRAQGSWSDDGMFAVSFVDATHGWVAGGYGVIMATTSGGVGPAPVTSATGDDVSWHKTSVTIALSALPGASGSPVAATYCFDGASGLPWQAGTSLTVNASSDHANDGVHRIFYLSTGADGFVESPQTRLVNIDTRRPGTQAPTAASATRGKAASLRYKVLDTKPNSGTATVKIVVKNRTGNVVKTLKPVVKPVNTALTWKFTVPLAWRIGTYKFYVYATDSAGNKQANIASNKLMVK